ncbi:2'-5' RNA ligase family protein [Bdellovibrio sp. HCB274]|uniref:2'-5' RNA ligase family protein n=1 Tax=Bdellovibrio sp. HCB274 TaxID=3394361 RepID=UPI0039B5CD15
MRAIQWVFIMLLLSSCSSVRTPSSMPDLIYTDEVYSPAAFIPHAGSGTFKNYLAMNLPYEGYQPILQQLESRLQKSLKNRGEAHITVITPVEFDKVLSRHLKMQDIHDVAHKMQIQQSPYRPLCLGQGQLKSEGKEENTYFVVVESEALFQIRKVIEELYIQKGGKSGEFKAELFFPHVTLGYTERDLHYEDGVTKDAASCIYKMEPGPRSK